MRDFALHLVVVPAERGAASPEEIQEEEAHDAESDSVVEDDTDPRPRHQLAEIVGTAHHRKTFWSQSSMSSKKFFDESK